MTGLCSACAYTQAVVELVHTDLVFREESLAYIGKPVIHGRIKLVAAQPLLRILPYFRDEECFRVFRPYRAPEGSPKIMVYLVGYIKSPSVNSGFTDPEAPHIAQVFRYFRVSGIQLWHLPYICESGVIQVPGIDGKLQAVKPILIGR